MGFSTVPLLVEEELLLDEELELLVVPELLEDEFELEEDALPGELTPAQPWRRTVKNKTGKTLDGVCMVSTDVIYYFAVHAKQRRCLTS